MKVLLSVVLLFAWSNASAYIDPGTGSAIVSTIVGLVVGIGVAVKTYWYKIKGLFSSSKKDAAANTGEPDSTETKENERS